VLLEPHDADMRPLDAAIKYLDRPCEAVGAESAFARLALRRLCISNKVTL